MAQIERILTALAELNRCVAERGRYKDLNDRWGLTIGECDWRAELHAAIYGEDNNEPKH